MDPLLNSSIHLACSTRRDRHTPLCAASFPVPGCATAALPAMAAAGTYESISPSLDNAASMGHYWRRVRNQQDISPWPTTMPQTRASDSMDEWHRTAVAQLNQSSPPSLSVSDSVFGLGQAFPRDPQMLAAVQLATNWANSYVPNPHPQVTSSLFVTPVPVPDWSRPPGCANAPAESRARGSCAVVNTMVGLPDSYDASPVIQLWGPNTFGY